MKSKVRCFMIKVLNPGMIATFQDLGRFGYRKYGVPVSGVMDRESYLLCNALLGNDSNEAVVEFALLGPKLQFEEATGIALTGAHFKALLNTKPIAINTVITVKKGDILSFASCSRGVYGYLGVRGGFKIPEILGSKSYYPSVTPNSKLHKGMELGVKDHHNIEVHNNTHIDQPDFNMSLIDAGLGPEFHLLTDTGKNRLMHNSFSISKNYNRMGIRLEESLDNELPSILSSGVLPGTVQLTPSGKMLVLMRDAQTTGGYPRILQLTDSAINIMAQLKYGNSFRFRLLDKYY